MLSILLCGSAPQTGVVIPHLNKGVHVPLRAENGAIAISLMQGAWGTIPPAWSCQPEQEPGGSGEPWEVFFVHGLRLVVLPHHGS